MRITPLFCRVAIAILALLQMPRAIAAENFLKQGIEAYQRGKYTEALGLLGAAKGTESTNPLLHYYMGHTLVQLKAPTDALREYKIARDLSPGTQTASYCDAAIASLEKASAAAQPHVFQTRSVTAQVKIPQVICFVCDCKMCAQVQPWLDRLYGQSQGHLVFLWIGKGASDERSKKLIQKYELSLHPTILLINEHGMQTKRFNELVNTDQLVKEVTTLGLAARKVQPTNSDERILAAYRKGQLDEVYVRVRLEEGTVRKETARVDDHLRFELSNLPRPRSSGFNNTYVAEEYEAQKKKLQAEGEKRKDEIIAASARRRMEFFAAAEEKIAKEEERLENLSQISGRRKLSVPLNKKANSE